MKIFHFENDQRIVTLVDNIIILAPDIASANNVLSEHLIRRYKKDLSDHYFLAATDEAQEAKVLVSFSGGADLYD